MFLPAPCKINKMILSANIGVKDLLSDEFSSFMYGVILRDCHLRTLPTSSPSISENGFDRCCESLCRCCEPAVFLENAPQNDFYKVQTCCAVGFVHKNNIAHISRTVAKRLIGQENMLYITDKFVLTLPSKNNDVSKIPLSFGTKIPFDEKNTNYKILLPKKQADGNAVWCAAELASDRGISEGRLKFTRKNILQLALRMRGMPYDWGESFGGCDCSSLVRTAFFLCGVNLPRNSADIARVPCKIIPFNCGLNTLCLCRPGDIICDDGHIMLYYGKKRNIHYVFHSFYGTRGITDITPVTEPTSEGTPLYEEFKKILPLSGFYT